MYSRNARTRRKNIQNARTVPLTSDMVCGRPLDSRFHNPRKFGIARHTEGVGRGAPQRKERTHRRMHRNGNGIQRILGTRRKMIPKRKKFVRIQKQDAFKSLSSYACIVYDNVSKLKIELWSDQPHSSPFPGCFCDSMTFGTPLAHFSGQGGPKIYKSSKTLFHSGIFGVWGPENVCLGMLFGL